MSQTASTTPLFDWEIYRKQQGGSCYDELLNAKGRPRRIAMPLFRHLQQLGNEGIGQIQRHIESRISALGITFTVYQDDRQDALDRNWPLDIIPRIIDGADWLPVAKGLEQRLRALNMFLDDIYHDGRILKDGVVPEAMVRGSARYLPECQGANPAYGVWAHVCGSDLMRDPQGRFCVIEDNLCIPSGVSYMLENRAVMFNVAAELFAAGDIAPMHDYPRQLYRTLAALAPRADLEPQVVVLTPGAFNSAYYEHAFLANQMGTALAESQDLLALDDRVYLRTINGLQRVDVIYRRVDDVFLDPTVFRNNSLLGVPGLIDVWRRGQVALANAPGCGVADDKVIYAYVPEIIRYYLGQDPLLPNVPTWLLHEKKARDHVLAHPERYVFKAAGGSGGHGIVFGPGASAKALAEVAAAVTAQPNRYIAQRMVALSTAPTVHGKSLEPRRLDLRPFTLQADSVSVTAGGLTRVAPSPSAFLVNSSQGGGSKDTWVMQPRRTRPRGRP